MPSPPCTPVMMTESNPNFDVEAARRAFPFYTAGPGSRGMIYLDNAATTQRPSCMINALVEFYRDSNANVRRGTHALARRATELFEEARCKIARHFGVADPRRVIFTRNATEALNLVAHAFAPQVITSGDAILVSDHEHHANFLPWQEAARRLGAAFHVARLPIERPVLLEEIRAQAPARLKLIAITRLSNATGVFLPVEDVIAWSREIGAHVVLDLAQAAAHEHLAFDELGADFGALSAHKVYGPLGIGVLLAAPGLLERTPPLLTGGEMLAEVDHQHFTPAPPPERFEAGTPDAAGAHAFARSLEFLEGFEREEIEMHERRLLEHAIARLETLPGLDLIGPSDPDQRAAVLSFTLAGHEAHVVAMALDSLGIALRAGDHCARPLHQRMGLSATLRASFALYNRHEEIDALADALEELIGA